MRKTAKNTVFNVIIFLAVLTVIPRGLQAETYEFPPASFSLSIPSGWHKQNTKEALTELEFEELLLSEGLGEVLETGRILTSYYKKLEGGNALLRVAISNTLGYLSPLDHENLQVQVSEGFSNTLPAYINLKSSMEKINSYEVDVTSGNFESKGKRMKLTQYLFSDDKYSFRVFFIYPSACTDIIETDIAEVSGSIKAGMPPEKFSLRNHMSGVLILAISLFVVLILAGYKMFRRFSKPTVALLFLLVMLVPSSARAEMGTNILFELSDNDFMVADGENLAAIEEAFAGFFTEVEKKFVLFAKPDLKVPDEEFENYQFMVYPIVLGFKESNNFKGFFQKYVEFNKLEDYKLISQEVVSPATLEVYSVSYSLVYNDFERECHVFARKFDFGWLVTELMAPKSFINDTKKQIITSLMNAKLKDPELLLSGRSAADLRKPGIIAVGVVIVLILVVMIWKRNGETS